MAEVVEELLELWEMTDTGKVFGCKSFIQGHIFDSGFVVEKGDTNVFGSGKD